MIARKVFNFQEPGKGNVYGKMNIGQKWVVIRIWAIDWDLLAPRNIIEVGPLSRLEAENELAKYEHEKENDVHNMYVENEKGHIITIKRYIEKLDADGLGHDEFDKYV